MTLTSFNSTLDGLRVIDLSTSVAGIQATQHLADCGAEVLFVEPPGGSWWRRHPSWPLWSRGKQLIEVDLRDAASLDGLRSRAIGTDVLVETFRPGVAERLGLSYEDLSEAAPRIVYGSVTGFGSTGRYAHVPAYEGTVMAALGIMHAYRVIHPRPGPVFASPWMCTASAAQLLLHGVLAALYERESSGCGQLVETSLVEAIASQDLNNLTHLFLRRRYPDAFEDAPFISAEGVPTSGMAFRVLVALTRDGRWLQFGQLSERLFRAMMQALELEWMYDDERWKTAPEFEDEATRLEFWEHMLVAARQKTLADWQAIFDADPNVWAELYRHGSELLDHPQLLHDSRVADVALEDGSIVRTPGVLIHVEERAGGEQVADARVSATASPPETPEHDAPDESGSAPLDGVTILELGMYFAGPLGATMLADLGARVIKVETLEGDPGRNFTGFPEAGGTRTMQGKESIAVDLASNEGKRIVQSLARTADVVLQSYRPGVASRLGVDAETLTGLNPDLIYMDAPGYGTTGPCSGRPSFAPTMGAASGFAMRNVGQSVPESADLTLADVQSSAARLFPATIIVGHADAFAAHAVATAILLGLVARKRGRGACRLETSMLSSMAHVLSDQMVDNPNVASWPAADPELHGTNALYRLYETAEGWLFLAAPQPREWDVLIDAIDDPRLRRPEFGTPADRSAHDAELASVLGRIFGARPAADWEARLISVGVAGVVVADATPDEVLLDNVLEAEGGYVTDVTHPLWDEHPRLRPALRFSRSETRAPAGCLCGEHTRQILTELDFTTDQIDELTAKGIVR